METLLDEHGQPVIKAFNRHRNFLKSVESLIGICRGLLADGQLVEQEIIFLDTWLKDNEQIINDWPADVIARRLRAILADGVITHDEAEDLRKTLEGIVGGGLEHGAVDGMATRLPVEEVETIEFDGKLFCFTGKFVYGSRKKCEQAIIDRGALAHPSVINGLDYLVIGTLASRDWINTSHGRKIESAVANKGKGKPVVILAEEVWVKHLT